MNLVIRHGAVVQPEREISVLAEVDVLVEQYGFLGGMMTAGGVGCICGPYTCAPGSTTEQIVFGLCGEFMRRLESRGAGYKYLHRFQVDHHQAKVVLDAMIVEAGVRPLYHTFCAEALLEGRTMRGAVIENKAGRQAILARVVIDATGDGDAAALAGVPHEKGDTRSSCALACPGSSGRIWPG